MLSKKLIVLTLIGIFLASSLLTACAGSARLDINVDPETGQGTIDIVGASGEGQQDTAPSGGMGTDSAIVLVVVVALFLAVIALVIALVGRRPSSRNE